MEESRIPKTAEDEAEPQRDQKHAHRVFSTLEGLRTMNLSPQGQTVNAQFYRSVLRRLREDIRRKKT